MDYATPILIVGGMSFLAVGALLGMPMVLARSEASRAPRYLFAAHLAAIIQGGLLLALTVAVDFASLSPRSATIATSLVVAGMALFETGLGLNWHHDIEDAFAASSLGNKVSGAGIPLILIGAAIIYYGVLTAL